jgi:hypothetical protein
MGFYLIKSFLVGNTDSNYRKLASDYKKYVDLNKIASFYDFDSFSSWKGLKAHGIKKFCLVSPFHFLKLGLVKSTSSPKIIKAFQYWCLLIQLTNILWQHEIPNCYMQRLQEIVSKLLEYHALGESGQSLTPNMHMLLHYTEVIKRAGCPVNYTGFGGEKVNGFLKPKYANTNGRDTAVTVFKRYQTIRVFNLLQHLKGVDNMELRLGSSYKGADQN